jgi:hypothetical protein
MLRLTTLWVFAAVAFAQNPTDLFTKAPPEIDQALRARINEFYEDHVKGEFRKAEKLVAEDTQELFYDTNKPKYLSFEISRIDYSENFTKAKATVICEQFVMFPGFAGAPQKIPGPSYWKIENGQWFWYVPATTKGDWPFGTGMKPGAATAAPKPSIPTAIPTSVEEFFNQVKADKQAVSMKGGDSDQITIANSAPGVMTLSVSGKLPGVEATLDRTDLKSGERAVLTVHAAVGAKSGNLAVHVVQTGQDLPVQVTVR